MARASAKWSCCWRSLRWMGFWESSDSVSDAMASRGILQDEPRWDEGLYGKLELTRKVESDMREGGRLTFECRPAKSSDGLDLN